MNELINRGVILTTRGQQLIEDAKATGRDIQLKKFGVGDGGGDAFNPTLDELKALTAVPGEWDKRNLNSVEPIESGGYTVEGLVPSDVGEGRWVRIFGIYTIDDQLMYVFLYPVWQKPQNNGNLLIELPFKATIGISDAPDFKLVIDPSLVAATQQFVKDEVQKHLQESHPHKQYALVEAHVIDSEPSTHNVVIGSVNVFASHAQVQLEKVSEGKWFLSSVMSSVDLSSGVCELLPPDGEMITHAGVEVPKVWFKQVNREFRFIRKNGGWEV